MSTILGYPRIGANRELKKALEAYWSEKTSLAELRKAAAELRAHNRARMVELGLTEVPLDGYYYDQMLAAAITVNAVPQRFAGDTGEDLEVALTMARGRGSDAAMQMTKWFDTNYHYLVPELDEGTEFRYRYRGLAEQVREAVAQGVNGRPVIVGPVTFLLLARPSDAAGEGFQPLSRLDDLVTVYTELVTDLAAAGATRIQFDEPGLVTDQFDYERSEELGALQHAYQAITAAAHDAGVKVLVTLGYGEAEDALLPLAVAGVDGITVDAVAGRVPGEDVLARLTAAADTPVELGVGIINGRNIWRADLDAALAALQGVAADYPGRVFATTSTSLQHVPHSVELETDLDTELRSWLAFADQKIAEVVVLDRALAGDKDQTAFTAATEALKSRDNHPGVRLPQVRDAVAAVTDAERAREPYAERVTQQDLGLPELPTTTIGSFPQTQAIRKARAEFRAGRISQADYVEAMRAEIRHVVEVQERLGLDVLVHGEAERNDMVQYFAENLTGFAATRNGWVQSYGSRCTRPSILWGDVSRPEPITVKWSSFAQSLTDKPMKGMLTGPVTILAWSFVRDDIPRSEVADQVALALREEIHDLEEAGLRVIQVDEPAIRETLPLRKADRAAYLKWSVGAFRLATGGAKPSTQVHTHLCYSDFATVMDAIDLLDADVTSIEASRSRMAIMPAIREHGFERGLGPGVWDIHSPRVPGVEEIEELLHGALAGVDARQLWVNPDCGLKTRDWPETLPTLTNLVEATKAIRAELAE